MRNQGKTTSNTRSPSVGRRPGIQKSRRDVSGGLGLEKLLSTKQDETDESSPHDRKKIILPSQTSGRGRMDSIRVGNDYLNQLYQAQSNPFKQRTITIMKPDQVSLAVENSYYSPASMARTARFLFQEHDIVCAATPRSGQNVAMKILDALVQQEVVPVGLTALAPWLESKANDANPLGLSKCKASKATNRRVFKTHISAGALQTMMRKNGKVVVRVVMVLRMVLFLSSCPS